MYLIVDQETGEVVAQNFVFFGRPRKPVDRGYVKVFMAFLDSILENDKIAGKSIRLLFYLMKYLDYNTLKVRIIPKYVMEELGICKFTFYKWIEDLEKEGIIRKIDRYTYEIQPYTFVRGDSTKALNNSLDEATESYKKQKQKKEKKGGSK